MKEEKTDSNRTGEIGGRETSSGRKPLLQPLSARRSAWVEIDLAQLRRNFACIRRELSPGVEWISVLKDEAYGHGGVRVARMVLAAGASRIALSNVEEGVEFREGGIQAPILLFGEILPEEVEYVVAYRLTPSISAVETARMLEPWAERLGHPIPVHVKVDTGMGRYGVRWTEAIPLLTELNRMKGIRIEGIYSHFARSDEADKEFAYLQLERFLSVCREAKQLGIPIGLRHICNTGGFLDLPKAHLDAVRIGILNTGVYPSLVCRRIPGIAPAMTVKARIVALKWLERGDNIGYGLRYQCPGRRRIAVIPVGYGDGYPRVRNEGAVLIHGRRAPIVGANAMDATMVDVTHIPEARLWDEVILMGRQGEEEITARDIAQWKRTICYEVLVGWRSRLPRVYIHTEAEG